METSLEIKGIKLLCSVGIHKHESRKKQPLTLDVFISGNFSEAASTDHFRYAVDYEKVLKLAQDLAKKKHFNLIEHFGMQVASEVCKQFLKVEHCRVRVTKTRALRNGVPIFEISASPKDLNSF